jgi:hypothetical protein
MWPTVVGAQRLLYRVLALCWAIEEAGRDKAAETARKLFGDNGLAAATQALSEISAAVTGEGKPAIPADVPAVLKAELIDLAGSLDAEDPG